MHELSLIQSLCETIEHEIIPEKVTRIVKIILEMGPLSGAEPILLQQCFEVVKPGSIFAEASLEIEFVPSQVQCFHCEHHYNPTDFPFQCPKCEYFGGEVLRGNNIIIKKLQMEVDD